MKRASLWRERKNGRAQCLVCRHFCRLLPGEWGLCGVRGCRRINGQAEIFTLVETHATAVHVDPIEKKPLFHYLPGSRTLSLGTPGCNFDCAWCQNADISRPALFTRRSLPANDSAPDDLEQRDAFCRKGPAITPSELVRVAQEEHCSSIAFTYTEPTIFFELMCACAEQAGRSGLGRVLVSNGYQSPKCLEILAPLIDAANIDLKAFSDDSYRRYCGAALHGVLDNLILMRRLGWWLEITTLVIPGINDSPEESARIARFIHNHLGADTPWHISAFFPRRSLLDTPPTSPECLEKIRETGEKCGLRYVYTGNTPFRETNTRCPVCGEIVIRRRAYQILSPDVDGICPHCGAALSGVWQTTTAREPQGEPR